MKKNISILYFTAIVVIIIYLLLQAGCSRNEPYVAVTPSTIQKIIPINTYVLDVSEPSGLAYNAVNNTFMVISDSHPEIYEISLNGATLNTIPASGSDMEGIALSKNCDTVIVVEERIRSVTSFALNGAKLDTIIVDVAVLGNSGLEGVTFNHTGRQMFVLNEKDPRMLLCYENLTKKWQKNLDYTGDVSDVCYEESTGFLWVISDESRMILKLSSTGTLIKQWEIPFSKGEGIAIVGDKIYVVNDQDGKMYVFHKPN